MKKTKEELKEERIENLKKETRAIKHPLKGIDENISYYEVESRVCNLESWLKTNKIEVEKREKMLKHYKIEKKKIEKEIK